MCYREPEIPGGLSSKSHVHPLQPIRHTLSIMVRSHTCAVGSSFHGKASAWKTKLLYLCAWHAPAKHLENTKWCAFLLMPSSFLSLAKTLPSSLLWHCSVDNRIDDRRTILALITAMISIKYFHCSLHFACVTGFIKQLALCIQYSWTEFLYM